MSKLKLLSLALPVFLLCAATMLRAQTYLSNQYEGSSAATTGSLTQAAGVVDVTNGVSTQYYESVAGLSLTGSGGLQVASGNAAYYAFFTNSPADISVASGGNITVSFDLTPNGPMASSTMKIGLFNSKAGLTGGSTAGFARPTLNTTGNGLITAGSSTQTTATAGNPYLNWSGYYLNFNPSSTGNTTNTIQTAQRASATTNSSLLTNGGSQIVLGSAITSAAGKNLVAGTTYHVSFTVTYTSASSVTLAGAVTQGATVMASTSQVVTDPTVIAGLGGTKFDTVGYNPSAGSTGGWVIDNLSVIVAGVPANAPSITAQPSPTTQSVVAGATITYSVTATGDPTPTYQWILNGTPLTDATGHISGSTTATLTLTNVQSADAGAYTVKITNVVGSATSNPASFSIATIPSAPNATAATNLSSNGLTANWDPVSGATNYHLDVSTASDFSSFITGYQDTDLGTATTATLSGLTESTTYYYKVRAANVAGTSGDSNVISVTTPATPLTISQQPTDQTVLSGADATFTAAATSVSALSYQWQSAAAGTSIFANITGETNATLTIHAAQASDYGTQYRVIVNNTFGPVTSNVVTLWVLTPPVANAATLVSTGGFTANWSSVANATGYRLDVSTSSSFATFLSGYSDLDVGTNLSATLTNLPDNSTFYYRVRAVFPTGTSASSSTVTVSTPPAPPVITQQPANVTVVVNNGTTFSAGIAASSTALSYQWQISTDSGQTFTNINLETNATLALTNLQFSDSGNQYRVIVTNSGGFVTSSAATLTVVAAATPPSITTQPQAQSVALGGSVTLTVAASGTDPLTYVWKNGTTTVADDTHISGSTTASLSITNAQLADAGDYTVTVTNVAGHDTSSIATLTVVAPPSTPVGSAATSIAATGFTANWASVSGATDYRLDVSTKSDFSALVTGYSDLDVGTNTSQAVSGLSANTIYYYRVRAANLGGTSASSTAIAATTLPTIATQPTNQTAGVGGSASFTVVVSGTAPVTYQWQLGTQNVSGTAATLTLNNVQTTDAGSYTVIVTNASGFITSTAATLTVVAAPTANAASLVTSARFAANWAAVANATGYYLDVATDNAFGSFVTGFQNLSLGTVTTLPVTGLSGGTAYYYRVRAVVGGFTSPSSNTISATTLSSPAGVPIVHDTMSAGTLHAGLTTDTNSYLVPTATQAVWASFGTGNVTYAQNTSLSVSAGATRALMAYFEPSASRANLAIGETLSASLTFTLSGGTLSLLPGNFRAGLYNSGSSGRFAPPTTSNSPTNSATADGYSGYLVDTEASTSQSTNTLSFWQRAALSTPTADSVFIVGTNGTTGSDLSSSNTVFSMIGSAGGGTAGAIANDGTVYRLNLSAKYVSGTQVDLTYTVTTGATTVMSYSASQTTGPLVTSFDSFVLFSSYGAKLTVLDLTVSKVLAAPTITTQPSGQTASVGDSVTLNVTAGGSPTLTYQWMKGSTALTDATGHISGSTTATLTLTGAQLADSGAYTVVVTNGVGNVTSNAATVTISPAAVGPSITTQPQSISVPTGGSTTLSVVASGTAPLSYQWSKGGSPIANATNSSLTLTNVQAGDAGSYTVAVSNAVSSVTSNAAVVTVTPAILTQPANLKALTGSIATFSVVAKGAGTLTYQWSKDGTALTDGTRISGSASAVLTVSNLTSSDAGNYTVVVTNAGGSITSSAAALTVDTVTTALPTLPTIPTTVYNVANYGLVATPSSINSNDVRVAQSIGSGGSHAQTLTDNASAIQSAINDALAHGGGIVEIPAAAGVYYSGPITLGSKINLQVDGGATLMALPYGTYPNTGADFITAPSGASDVAITGAGVIDGNGAAWWTAYNANNSLNRPRLLQFTRATNVLISSVTLKNSPQFHIALSNFNNNVTITGVTITADASSPNTDGIDPAGSNILIQNCSIAVGDDNIAVKASGTPCTNITVAYCSFGVGHGLSIGGQTNFGVNGMTVTQCTFTGTTSGLRMKADATEGGLVQNVTYSNLTMTNVTYPIVFYSYYNELGSPGTTSGSSGITPTKVNARNGQAIGGSAIPGWQNIAISNLTSTGSTGYSIIWGLPLANGLISNVTFSGVTITGGAGVKIYNAAGVQLLGTASNNAIGTLTTDNALIITGQPLPQTASVGGSASFSVTAVGTGGTAGVASTYQWNHAGVPLVDGVQSNGAVVAGSHTATMTISNVGAANSVGGYSCTVSNTLDGYSISAGALAANSLPVSTTSQEGALTVNGATGTAPTITTEPTSQTANVGTRVTFTVAASPDSAVTSYEWQKQGSGNTWSDVTGATSASLTLNSVQISDAGSYRVLVWNANGNSASDTVTLTVHSAPVITQQPVGPTDPIAAGGTLSLSVAVNAEASPVTYQWYKDGTALADDSRVTGSATSALQVSSIQYIDAGNYTVIASNDLGSATSTPVAVQVSSVPPAPVATAANDITSSRFQANWNINPITTGYRLDVSTASDFSSFLTGFQNRDIGSSVSQFVGGLSPSTTYYYRVRAVNAVGTSDNSATITVSTTAVLVAPVILSPNSTTFTIGIASSFTVAASGSPAPTYQATGLPAWATLDATSGLLSGTAPSGTAGAQIPVTITASNGTSPNAIQAFTLNVQDKAAATAPMTITTLAGQALTSGAIDATGSAARFKHISGVALDNNGNIYVADTDNETIRQVTTAGVVTTLAGTVGTAGSTNGTGTAAKFNGPTGVAVDQAGNVFVADTLNHTIRQISSAGAVITRAGLVGTPGSADDDPSTRVPAGAARFSGPQGVAFDQTTDSIYIADTNNHTIRVMSLATGKVATVAGLAGSPGSADGVGSAARFNYPSDLAVDRLGNVYVADTDNNTVRVISTNGEVRTLAGFAGSTGAADGIGTAARFSHPSALAVDSSLNVYVLDSDHHTIRRIASAAGTVTTTAGLAGTSGSADGTGTAARFNEPTGIAQASTGEFYIADTNNFTLREGVFPGAPVITAQPQSASVTAGATVQFFVTATGQPAPTYQWMQNGAAISGATSSTLTLSSVQVLNSGQYTVVVTNASGSVTSNAATLTVTSPNPGGGVNGGGGGGGAPGWFFYAALAALGLARWIRSHRNR